MQFGGGRRPARKRASSDPTVVVDLDALGGTPVLDIKPVLAEFLPDKGDVRQPSWSHQLQLLENYFLPDA